MAEDSALTPSVADSIAAAIDVTSSEERNNDPVVETANRAEEHAKIRTAKPPATEPEILARDGAKPRSTGDDTRDPVAEPKPEGEKAAPPEAGQKPPVAEADAPPASWKEPVKAAWNQIPPEARAEILRREKDISIGLQKAAETRKFGDSLARELSPYMDMLAKEGATPQVALKSAMEFFYTLRNGAPEHKKALILSVLDQYGIDFRPGVNPEVARLQHQIDMQNNEKLRNQGQQQYEVQQASINEVDAFASQPGHEHLDTLRPQMAALLQAGQATDLNDAYEKAAWAHPEVRPYMLQKQNLERQVDLTKNRRAASSVTGSPGNASTGKTVDPRNLRGMLEDAFGGGRL